ncbi:MAG: ethylbenzene dehydrogenase-related protein [bacterium]
MKKQLVLLSVVAVLLSAYGLLAQTTVNVTEGTPVLDGVASAGEWTSNAITTQAGLTIQAMVDETYFYVLTSWADKSSSESTAKNQWSFDGTAWSQTGNEDRVGIIWDMGQNGDDGPTCTTMCHQGIAMQTQIGKVDVWHWKSARTNPLGYSDDKFWDTTGRHGDTGTGIDTKNLPVGSGFPSFMAGSDPGANVDFLMGDQDALNAFDPFNVGPGTAEVAVAFDSTATFSAGAVIPGRILSLPTGNRASVHAAGKYDNGIWTVEFRRVLDGDEDDFDVVMGGSVDFSTEIFDNEGSGHPGDGFDATVYTMQFPTPSTPKTSLTAAIGSPNLDGVDSPGEWTSDMITTEKGLTIKAMIDQDNLYVLAQWMDKSSTENIAKSQWSFDGTSWSQAGDEDRVGIIWDMGQNGDDGATCTTMCHQGIAMQTQIGKVDVWHWKSARTNPLGYSDDKFWDTTGRHGDTGSGIDTKNLPVGSGFPSFMATSDPGGNVDFLMGDQEALNAFDPFNVGPGTAEVAVAFDSTAAFSAGAVIPGRILSLPTGNRASVRVAGKYDNGKWTVEFSRPLVSDGDDFEVVPGGSVDFSTEIFDNEGSGHPGDGFDATVFTMNFPQLPSDNSLTATIGTPTLDGVEANGEWTSDMITTAKGLTIKSMVDSDYLYVLAKWPDKSSTENVNKAQWSFDGTSWSQAGDEDRVGIIWDMGQNGDDGANCTTMCHQGIAMQTQVGKVDVWHWKAARTNPLGFADDKFWDTTGRHGDAGSGIDSKNLPVGSGFPSFMAATDPGANVTFLMADQDALNAFDPFGVSPGTTELAVEFDSTAAFATGAVIPGRILALPTGNRASVHAAGKYDNGVWTVEFKRALTSDGDDFSVVSEGSVQFATEIFDNEGSGHPGDGFDATVYTLNFPLISSVSETGPQIPGTYALNQNYPNPFNPRTTITFSLPDAGHTVLKIYNLLGQEVATLVDENLDAGAHTIDFGAANLSSGIYLYKLSVNGFSEIKKMALVK